MKHMDEIIKAERTSEDAKKNDAEMALRKELKAEIDEIWDKKNESPEKFLKLLSEKYVSYKSEKVEFTEEQLKSSNLKKTLIKATIHYHPDKKTLADGKMNEKDFYLRDEIIKAINNLTSEMKGFE